MSKSQWYDQLYDMRSTTNTPKGMEKNLVTATTGLFTFTTKKIPKP
jgi:hypothetical protein